MDFDGIDALDLAVDHREALGRKRIERIVIDALITGAWANDQPCLGRRLTVTRQFEFDLSQITIGIESHSLAGIETRRVIVNRKLDLSGSAGDIDGSITGFGCGTGDFEVSSCQYAIDSRVPSHDLQRMKKLFGWQAGRRRKNQFQRLGIVLWRRGRMEISPGAVTPSYSSDDPTGGHRAARVQRHLVQRRDDMKFSLWRVVNRRRRRVRGRRSCRGHAGFCLRRRLGCWLWRT